MCDADDAWHARAATWLLTWRTRRRACTPPALPRTRHGPPHATATQLPLTPRAAQVTRTAVQTATFQLLASIAAPFVVIHTAVDLAKRSLAHTRAARIGPVIAGLALIPALPLVDHPIEHGARVVKRAHSQITLA